MKISLNWLRDNLAWEGSTEELVDILTESGMKVETVKSSGIDFPKVVITKILDSQPHPNADRLSVCKVDDGSGTERQIVCGAKNYKVGDKVPLALPGAVLPGDFKIKVGKLRGVESEGMMCSGKELGLSSDAQGLLILPENAQVGEPIASLYPEDTIFELEITPNRGDWLSHIGVAREVAAFTGAELKLPVFPAEEKINDQVFAVRVDDVEACPFYSLRRISHVRVGPSPDWLKNRLEAVGLRSINNIVDITNFVMMECGQPLHAFDKAKVHGGVRVRQAVVGESFLALDGKNYVLQKGDLVIADDKQVLGLAGVMGGEQSGVQEGTTEVLLESAWFAPSGIRRTSRRLSLVTDSSYRFERHVAREGILRASARAAQLIQEIAGGKDEGMVIVGEQEITLPQITLRHARCRTLLGHDFSADYIEELLERVGCRLIKGDEESSLWEAPGFRSDLLREVDLVEEVARLHGIADIHPRLYVEPAYTTEADRAYDFAQNLRRRLAGYGFLEARTGSLVDGESGQGGILLRNPMGEDQSYLRPSLIPGLLVALTRNIRRGISSVRLFEVGRVFHANGDEERSDAALVLSGSLEEPSWRGTPREADIFSVKGIISGLLPGVEFHVVDDPCYPLALKLELGGAPVGKIAQLAPGEAAKRDARSPVVFAEWNVDAVRKWNDRRTEDPFISARFPVVIRDIAVVAPQILHWGELEKSLRDAEEPYLSDIHLFDVFSDPEGKRLAADKKSIAFSLTFRSSERTLESDEVQDACDRLKTRLREQFQVEFRE